MVAVFQLPFPNLMVFVYLFHRQCLHNYTYIKGFYIVFFTIFFLNFSLLHIKMLKNKASFASDSLLPLLFMLALNWNSFILWLLVSLGIYSLWACKGGEILTLIHICHSKLNLKKSWEWIGTDHFWKSNSMHLYKMLLWTSYTWCYSLNQKSLWSGIISRLVCE